MLKTTYKNKIIAMEEGTLYHLIKDDVDAPANLEMDRFLEATVLELLHQTIGNATVSKEFVDSIVQIFVKGNE